MSNNLAWTTIFDPRDAPSHPGVYVYQTGSKILYIGKAVSLRARLLSHAQNARLDPKESAIVRGASHIRYTLTDNDFLALLLESKLIHRYQPPYNLASKDDKSYLYILFDLRDDFPKPQLIRGRDLPAHRQAKYFGPFPSSEVAEEVLAAIRRLIPFCRQTQIGKRACFYSHVGLCDPCPSAISRLTDSDRAAARGRYRSQIRHVIRILRGHTSPVIESLSTKMRKYSLQQRYEEALKLRRKLEKFQRWIDTHSFSDTRLLSVNQTAVRLESLYKLLREYIPDLNSLSRIECFDASNLLFQYSAVSMVVLTDGRIDKSQYRRFRIKNLAATSDFGRLEEALTRRFRNRWARPNLLCLDGGKPQVRMALKVLDRLPDPPLLIGIAKAPDRLIIPKSSIRTTYITVKPPVNHPGFNLLKLLRDESHRFANAYRLLLENRSKIPS